MKPIPLIRPLLPDMKKTLRYFDKSKKANQYSNFGPCHNLAVEKLLNVTGRHMTPVTNGTAAIQVALETLPGNPKRVVIPDYTHVGTIMAVIGAGMIPVLCDTNQNSWQIQISTLEKNKDKYDCILVVSPFGRFVDTIMYDSFAKVNNKYLVYDFAGAWGNFPYTNNPVCYSLHATKLFSTGEGGIVSLLSENDYVRSYLNFGIRESGTPVHKGYNLKMDELRCAMLCAHMEDYSVIINKMIKRLKTIRAYSHVMGGFRPLEKFSQSLAVLDYFEIDDDPKNSSDVFVSKYYYPLLSRMPIFKNIERIGESGSYFTKNLAIPIDVTTKEQDAILRCLA